MTDEEARPGINALQEDTKEQNHEIEAPLEEIADMIQGLPPRRELLHKVQHRTPAKPGRAPEYPKGCYQLLMDQLRDLRRQPGQPTEKGFVVPSNSSMAASVFSVKQRDGTLRMVAGSRALNATTIKIEYTLPRINDLLDRLGSARRFSTLDMQAPGGRTFGEHPRSSPPLCERWAGSGRARKESRASLARRRVRFASLRSP